MSLRPVNLLFSLVGYSCVANQRVCGNRANAAGDKCYPCKDFLQLVHDQFLVLAYCLWPDYLTKAADFEL